MRVTAKKLKGGFAVMDIWEILVFLYMGYILHLTWSQVPLYAIYAN